MRSPLRAILEKKGRKIHSIGREASVLKAVELMNDERIGAVLVMAGGRPAGIFTERDVLVRVVAKGKDPAETPLAEAMTRDLVVVGADTTVEEAMAICSEKRCRHLPVMEGEKLLGLVSAGDLARWVSSKQTAEIQDLIRYIRDGHFT